MKTEYINETQSQDFRKLKYAQLRQAGFNREQARRMRDWKLNAVIAELSKATSQTIKQTSFSFHRTLKDAGIEKEESCQTKNQMFTTRSCN